MAKTRDEGDWQQANRWRIAIWSTAAVVLLLPLLAMQVTKEATWGVADFIIFGGMLVGACGTYELAARVSGNRAYRVWPLRWPPRSSSSG